MPEGIGNSLGQRWFAFTTTGLSSLAQITRAA